jgi:hypothetical protein
MFVSVKWTVQKPRGYGSARLEESACIPETFLPISRNLSFELSHDRSLPVLANARAQSVLRIAVSEVPALLAKMT